MAGPCRASARRQVLFAVFSGAVSWSTYVVDYFIPVVVGNTLGGVVFVALLNHLQVASETEAPAPPEPVRRSTAA